MRTQFVPGPTPRQSIIHINKRLAGARPFQGSSGVNEKAIIIFSVRCRPETDADKELFSKSNLYTGSG